MSDMMQFEQAVDQVVEDSERLHKVVNGTATETVVTEDGSTIPTVRKALMDNLYFKTPPLPWRSGTQTTVFNQLYAFNSSNGVQWWYAPAATVSSPVTLPANPADSVNWRLYNDAAAMAQIYAPLASPILTGNPQAPTAPANSNSNTIATTAFVASAITAAFSGFSTGTVSFAGINVSGNISTKNIEVRENSTFLGNIDASNVKLTARNIELSQQGSVISFIYTDQENQTYLQTQVKPYSVQTHSLVTDSIVNGIVTANDTDMSFIGAGNNSFDYVYITGNAAKAADAPRLVVSGTTQLQDLEVTGSVRGINVSVDGMDISPQSVTTSYGVTVGGDLVVNGLVNLSSLTVSTLNVSGDLAIDGSGSFTDGVTTTTITASGDVAAETLSATSANITQGLTVEGDVSLNGTTGTTTVNNLAINGQVSGLNIDLTGQSINVEYLSVAQAAEMNSGNVTTDLYVGGVTNTSTLSTTKLILSPENVATPASPYIPSGTSNVINLSITQDTQIAPWPIEEGSAFTAWVYLTQDATGGHVVSFDPSYSFLNTETVNNAAGSVTVLQLIYPGVGTTVDVLMYRRQ